MNHSQAPFAAALFCLLASMSLGQSTAQPQTITHVSAPFVLPVTSLPLLSKFNRVRTDTFSASLSIPQYGGAGFLTAVRVSLKGFVSTTVSGFASASSSTDSIVGGLVLTYSASAPGVPPLTASNAPTNSVPLMQGTHPFSFLVPSSGLSSGSPIGGGVTVPANTMGLYRGVGLVNIPVTYKIRQEFAETSNVTSFSGNFNIPPSFNALEVTVEYDVWPEFLEFGAGLPGSIGQVAHLTGSGGVSPIGVATVSMTGGLPYAAAVVVVAIEPTFPVVVFGGPLESFPAVEFHDLNLNVLGAFSASSVRWPNLPPGQAWVLQVAIVDPSAPMGVAFSSALRCTYPD